MENMRSFEFSDLQTEVNESNGSKEYFHIVTRKSNGRNNPALKSSVGAGSRRGRKRGRRPRGSRYDSGEHYLQRSAGEPSAKYSVRNFPLPSLMVNERQRRKTSSRFNSYLEVLKGEKEFYIENEDIVEDDTLSAKRGRGRKKKQPLWDADVPSHHVLTDGHLSLLPESIDEFSDKTCVIHVKENVDEGHDTSLNASVEDKNAPSLGNVVQEILNLPSSESTRIFSKLEQLGEKSEVLSNVKKESDEIHSFSDFKEVDLHIGEPIFEIADVTDMKTFQISDTIEPDVTPGPPKPLPAETGNLHQSSNSLSSFPPNNFLSTRLELSKETESSKEIGKEAEHDIVVSVGSPIENSDIKKFRCKLCSNFYSSFAEANHHAKTAHSYTIVETRMNKKTSDSYFKCPDCERRFPTERGRNKHHLLMHLKNSPSKCPKCSLSFNTSRTLERHLRDVHECSPSNFCDICEEEFVLGTSLEHHISISHPSNAKFDSLNYYVKQMNTRKRLSQCPICNKILVGIKAFRLHHEKVHNGEAFSCKQCKFKSTSASVLKRHLASVHKAIDLSLFVCSICKVGYQMAQDLEEHYIMLHNKVQTYQCSFCGEKFACIEMLRFHKGKHRAFPCDFCPIGFMKQETLEEHLSTVHKNDLSKETETLFDMKASTSKKKNETDQDPNSVLPLAEDSSSAKILEIKQDGTVEVQEEERLDDGDSSSKENSQGSFSKVHHLLNTKEGKLQEMDVVDPLKGFKLKDLPKKINCPICSKLLTTVFLRTHMRSHQGSFPHKCPKCSKAYAQGTLLRKHMKNRHYEDFLKLGNKLPKKRKVQCEYCELIFEDIYLLEDHLWTHMDEKSYKCETCRIKFGMKINWMEHYKTHYFKEEKQCPNCDRTFKSVGYYREHIERCQSNWTCEECGFKCENPELYRRHKKIEHTRDAVLHKCTHCKKSFYNRYNYEDHLLTHSSKKQFTCHLCDKEFKRQRPLNEHITRVHSAMKHICSHCSLSFDSSTELQVHAREHRRVQMLCGECDAIYLSRQTLDNHIAIHHNVLNQDPFICSFCSEVFEKQINLKEHLPSHSPFMVFVCQVNRCHKMFRKEVLLRSHMVRRHSYLEYYCHFCDSKFVLDSDLQKHVSTHLLELQLKCNKCPFTCFSKLQMQFHECEHTDEKPYECGVCNTQSSQKSEIILHMQNTHNLQPDDHHMIVNMWKCSVCEKAFVFKKVFLKHLEQHALHGVQAEGTLTKYPPFLPINKVSDILLNATNLSWEDLLSLLKVEVIALTEYNEAGEPVKLAMSSWQCSTCFFMTNTEENIRKHITSNVQCFDGLIELFTSKLNAEETDSKPQSSSENVVSVLNSDYNIQSIMAGNQFDANSPTTSKEPSLLLMDNNLQLVMNGDSALSELLNSAAESSLSLMETPNCKLQPLDNSQEEPIQLEVPSELLTETGVLNSTGVLIQMEDGRLVIPEMGSGVAQYHLVKEETDNHGTTESTYEILQSNAGATDEISINQPQTFVLS